MSSAQSLKGEQSKAQTRRKIANAVKEMVKNRSLNFARYGSMPKGFTYAEIAQAAGLSESTVRRNKDHVSLIESQESGKVRGKTSEEILAMFA